MRITDIVPTKRGRYSIFIDHEFFCAFHADYAFRLKPDMEISEDALDELRRESEYKIARERALNLLSRRAYTEKGLYDKLLLYSDEHAAAAATARMIELGLLDDVDFARRFAEERMSYKGYSCARTALELAKKGIDREIIGDVLSEMEDDPAPAIAKIVLKKHPRFCEDEKSRAKAVNALLRLGYRYGDIAAVLRNLEEDENYYEEE